MLRYRDRLATRTLVLIGQGYGVQGGLIEANQLQNRLNGLNYLDYLLEILGGERR